MCRDSHTQLDEDWIGHSVIGAIHPGFLTYNGLVFQGVKSTECYLVAIFDRDKGEKKSSFVCLFYQLGRISQSSQEVGAFQFHRDGI